MVEIRAAAVSEAATRIELDATPTPVRLAAGDLARTLASEHVELDARELGGERLVAFVEGLALGLYRFTRAAVGVSLPRRVDLCGVTDIEALERGLRSAAATAWARELANTRSNEKTPAWLGEQAERELRPLGVRVRTHETEWLRELGFGGLLAVGGGSAATPRLIEASWAPRDARRGEHIVFVGKGITFDTGGVNRKTGTGMSTMYTDMSGGAAVLAAMRLIATEQIPIRVNALVPSAENALSGSSYRPGDVVRHFGGRTSEVANTDAEGRLVLADAIAYAAARLRPTVIVDLATLTAAMKVALGERTAGLFATSDELATGLRAAGDAAGEPLWRMPMPVEYQAQLESSIADATNSAGNPGAITAAMFLRPFAAAVPWAHLDIAGPARAGADDGMFSQGATGFGARLLHRWVAALT